MLKNDHTVWSEPTSELKIEPEPYFRQKRANLIFNNKHLDSFGIQIRYNRLPNWLGRVFMVFLSFQFINMDFIPRQNIFQYSSKCCKQRKSNILREVIQKLNLIYWTTSSGFDGHSTIPKLDQTVQKALPIYESWLILFQPVHSYEFCRIPWYLSHFKKSWTTIFRNILYLWRT